VLVPALALVAIAAPAWAHVAFDPDEAAPGTIVSLTLRAAHEREGIGMTRVELFFPEDVEIPVVETPQVPGWTTTAAAPIDATAPAQLTWEGGPALDTVELPLTIGPLPDAPGRLQFKVLQTYANGDVDRWISEWPLGAPEPDQPGPVLDLVEGAPGTVPPTSDPTTPTSPPETPTSAPPTTATAPAGDDEEGDGVAVLPIALGVIVVGGGAFWWWLRRRRP
jgi:hypothetical protein